MLVVGAAIIDHGQLLACRRISPAALSGLYEFPGGKVEKGEEPREALIREVREELAIEIDCETEPLGRWVLDSGAELLIYRARLSGARPVMSSDHDDLVWLEREDWLDGVAWIDIDREAVRLLRDQTDREQSGEGEQ